MGSPVPTPILTRQNEQVEMFCPLHLELIGTKRLSTLKIVSQVSERGGGGGGLANLGQCLKFSHIFSRFPLRTSVLDVHTWGMIMVPGQVLEG